MSFEKQEEFIEIFKGKIDLENYVFNKINNPEILLQLKASGYFNPENAPGPKETDQKGYFSIPQWNVLSYLEKVSEQVKIEGNSGYILELLYVIDNVTKYYIEKGKIQDNYRTWWFFVKILVNIPNDKIQLDILKLVRVWLDSKFDTILPAGEVLQKLIPKFLKEDTNLEDIKKAEELISAVLEYKKIPLSEEKANIYKKTEEIKLVVDDTFLMDFFKQYSAIIGKKCSKEFIFAFAEKIKGLIKENEEGTYSSFYEEEDYPITEPLAIYTFALKSILDEKAKCDKILTMGILRIFLLEERYFFKKISVYIIGKNIEQYSDFFWESIEKQEPVIRRFYADDEIRHLFNGLQISEKSQIKALKIIIEAGPIYKFEKQDPKYLLKWKQRRYEALSHIPEFKEEHEKLKVITGKKSVLAPLIGKSETTWVRDTSPFDTKKIAIMLQNDTLVDELKIFKSSELFSGPNIEGLATELRIAVEANPQQFSEKLEAFIGTYDYYITYIMWGFKNAQNNGKEIDWIKILDFVFKYIDRPEFWIDKYSIPGDNQNHRQLLGVLGELIKDGAERNNIDVFNNEIINKAKKIVYFILDKNEKEEYYSGGLDAALNTTYGKNIEGLIRLLKRKISKIEEKNANVSFVNEILSFYLKLMLERKIPESFVWFGYFLGTFYWYDKQWTKSILEKVNYKDINLWEAFMNGYFWNPSIFSDVYKIMIENYKIALKHDFKDRLKNRKVIEHITIGYIYKDEKLEDANSLINVILNEGNPEQLEEMVGVMWMHRDHLKSGNEKSKEQIERILKMWGILHKKYSEKVEKAELSKEEKALVCSLGKLTCFLSELNKENYEWLLFAGPYTNFDFTSPFLIEYLNELKNKIIDSEKAKVGEYYGDIFVAILKKFTPDFKQEHIKEIIEWMYATKVPKVKEKADVICNIFGSRGYEFLRELWKNNRE